MPSLFDIFAQAQNGAGMQALAQQFGLSMQQTQAAVEALLPAFSQGLQRNTADPYGLGAFMTAMASGQHAKYFEDATRAFSPQGINEGNGILGHLFGSKELSRAVASQAAQATGLSQQVLQQMLPAMASMMMGGLFKQTTNQMQAAGGFGGGGNPLGEIIEQMMRQAGGSAQHQQAPNPYGDNPLGKVLQDMFGGGAQQPQSQPQQAPNPYGDNPLGKMFEEMLRQGGGGFGLPGAEPAPQQPQASQPRQAPQPQTNPSGRPRNPFDDIFGKMFETGAQQRDEYQKGMETIFDQFKRGMDRR
ncbi:DUF937 domain-containing protein [Mesorhizobium sp. M4B.F.Ca.ET.215.01.1.1]|uniref:DUF937 domain-containing protein n=2 Tax=Mesorhizobium TaxID=68287 RepID=UPI000FCB4B13|nr:MULTISPECIES: DUF937 domain-containing protein [unclassified Mesorhizobium]TIT26850.1 MAG: DUF937 domain-containing protein [Mesorhizobium sp.]RUW22372.1 DUF937 domain-containing protein [Mesorhizobium sp. M4B.F.Ca.ET.013.02.1.1]RVD38394.1 DUF937 domain-containing protein [Mesorhizobium sp. M4B.F.Ca.ET.019.03.1.1]TGQ05333.1 DUF937 domain-containing protein [Mesorhizobium sp. M4B.F.Ca.ET.215.01.1.1]TGQ31337.1 DUF937 domain-containing protein [Mesorhizobium sp. M00.F.Ca.ET.220.01.1.1]